VVDRPVCKKIRPPCLPYEDYGSTVLAADHLKSKLFEPLLPSPV